MRVIRKLKPIEENNFEIIRSDNLTQIMFENIKYVTIAAMVIGVITLFGSAIGLMNIMLVSVTERTKEIGTRKVLSNFKNYPLAIFSGSYSNYVR